MPPGRFLRGATGSSSRPGHVAGVGLHARPRELGTQARPTDSLGRWGAEKEMKDGERETSKRGRGGQRKHLENYRSIMALAASKPG